MASTVTVQNVNLWNRTASDADSARQTTVTLRGTNSLNQTDALATVAAQHAGTAADAKGRLLLQVNDGSALRSGLLLEATHVDAAAVTNVPQMAVGSVYLDNQSGVLVVAPAAAVTSQPTLTQTVTSPLPANLQTAVYVQTAVGNTGTTYTNVGPHSLTFNQTWLAHSAVTQVDSRTFRFNRAGQYRVHVYASFLPQAGVTATEYTVTVVPASLTQTALLTAQGTGTAPISRAYVGSAGDPQAQEHVLHLEGVAANTLFYVWVAPAAGSPSVLRQVAVGQLPVHTLTIHYLGTNGA